MKRTRQKVARRSIVDRPVLHRNRTAPSRVVRIKPDPAAPFVVEVRIARDRRRMRDATNYHEGAKNAERDRKCMGLVRSYHSRITGRSVIRPRGVIARMFLNVRDLRTHPSEIVAHECGHAAMAWARVKRADLSRMPGEEVMAHALGQLVRQLNAACYALGVWA